MPELPDVETFRRYLVRTSLRRRIQTVSVRDERILRDVSASTMRRRLRGATLTRTWRRGKLLFVAADRGGWLVLHFGMTGYLRRGAGDGAGDGPHDRLVLRFAGGQRLAFVCPRLFGYASVCDDPADVIEDRELGPDALEVDTRALRALLAARHETIKAALMDQSLLAGLGNVYADEILYQARVLPTRKVASLDDGEIRRMGAKLHYVLDRAIDARAQPDAMPNTWLTPHRHEGEPCPRCATPLERRRVRQRSAYACPRCQH